MQMQMQKVVAKERGWDGFKNTFREPGDTFEVPEGYKDVWYEPVDEKRQAKKGDDGKGLV